MSSWGWHRSPGSYTLGDVEPTIYEHGGKTYKYAVERLGGTGEAYDWLRHNPHRLNLARIALLYQNAEIDPSLIQNIDQKLSLDDGVITSRFVLFGRQVTVYTVCAADTDALGFAVQTQARGLSVRIDFPYASHKKNASDWISPAAHQTLEIDDHLIERRLDGSVYYVRVSASDLERTGEHSFTLPCSSRISFTVSFSPEKNIPAMEYDEVYRNSSAYWKEFWEDGGFADFSACKDPRAYELERRTIHSMYLTAIHSAGNLPPQETGLACNSWYGKFHLEMHILHSGWFPLWGRSAMLERSLPWYKGILSKAKENAARNGFKGARWPKMTGPEGIDSPSRIATLLAWQQPHILYMLKLCAAGKPGIIGEYWDIIRETADFICDFVKEDARGVYNLEPPLIPAQEEHKPMDVRNPAFELAYFHFGLKLAAESARSLNKSCDKWERVAQSLAAPPIIDGLYAAHENCPNTFTRYNKDHPSMLYSYGFIPYDGIDTAAMNRTVDKALSCWNWSTSWGWDFALTAMTLTRLGRPEDAVDILLAEMDKNYYAANGNNYQRGRDDLPLYLPGNGSLLFALAMMLGGYGDSPAMPGFPKNGEWDVAVEGILPLPH
jgi:hypothetical protein